MKWYIGCSGFYYNHWKEFFYPADLPKSKWFNFYHEHFNTLELNVTFYRFPKLSVFEGWYKKSPATFRFSVKAPRIITHYKQFVDTPEMMAGYYNTIQEGLQDKLGCVLFQLPPRAAFSEERLTRIINTLDPRFNNVVEFRHESWWNAIVYNELTKNNIAFCGISHPTLPETVLQNVPFVYYRFHGVPELYRSEYKQTEIKTFSDEISANKKTKECYVYFNNDIGGSAIINATQLQRITDK